MNPANRYRSAGVVLALVLLGTVGCWNDDDDPIAGPRLSIIEGSGNVITVTRSMSGCNAVRQTSLGTIKLDVQPGAAEELTIRAEDNIVPHLQTDVRGSELVIWTDPNIVILPKVPIQYSLTIGDLESVHLAGIGEIVTNALQIDALNLELSGQGEIRLSALDAQAVAVRHVGAGSVVIERGDVATQSVTVLGSGSYEAKNMDSGEADVEVEGPARATVRVRDRLTATASGPGSIRYCAPPTAQVTSTGDVDRLPDNEC